MKRIIIGTVVAIWLVGFLAMEAVLYIFDRKVKSKKSGRSLSDGLLQLVLCVFWFISLRLLNWEMIG
ncbi:MAG: hypothetical protein A2172_01040 [Candidatus Woykebacteria bacterium RBG_13_40_15]|uniref:Uncharacterized protein n=1 Tax=Candidatus Woykebacteria bacterium RBG_13_40_15 TaxID=1802593 RepID=A0A1G1W8W2_9BACT|nr:MAG: hypothetical protein A2172_01040 [Candidatus Woykebacteria bacterium RBG_13_40_15]